MKAIMFALVLLGCSESIPCKAGGTGCEGDEICVSDRGERRCMRPCGSDGCECCAPAEDLSVCVERRWCE
jgi:hypothetical protein